MTDCLPLCIVIACIRPCPSEAVATDSSHPHDVEQAALRHDDLFGVKSLVTVKDLFTARVHLGHKRGSRSVYMLPYVFGCRHDVDLIDLDRTLERLHTALNVMAHVAYRRGVILFLSNRAQTMPWVERMAAECGEYSHCRKWYTGTFTNSPNVFKEETRLPDLCVLLHTVVQVVDTHEAVMEAAKLMIPVVAVVDTNSDPRLVTYPIPGNDDSPSAVALYCRLFKEAVTRGKAKRKEDGLD